MAEIQPRSLLIWQFFNSRIGGDEFGLGARAIVRLIEVSAVTSAMRTALFAVV